MDKQEDEDESFGENEKLLENKLNTVAGAGKFSLDAIKAFFIKPQGKAIAGVAVVFVVFVAVKLFFSKPNRFEQKPMTEKALEDAKKKDDAMLETPNIIKKQNQAPEIVSAPPVAPQLSDPEIPDIVDFKDEMQDRSIETKKAAIEPLFEEPADPQPNIMEESDALSFRKKRTRDSDEKAAPMFNLAGTGPTDTDDGKAKKSVNDFIFVGGDIDTTSDDNFIEPKRIPALENTIAQGRTLNAVLETSIDSSIQGTVRAIVSNDVYAEISDNILIPRGSRLYGNYQTLQSKGIARLGINFTRIIRPDGVSVDLSSFASDQFGRAGVEGNLDSGYSDMIGLTFLESVIALGNTLALSQISNNVPQMGNITGTGGLITQIQNPASQAATSLVTNIGSRANEVAKSMFQTNARVTINQGTRITIVVNQDIKLPVFKPIKSSYSAIKYYDSSSSKSSSGKSSSSSSGGKSLGGSISSAVSSATGK